MTEEELAREIQWQRTLGRVGVRDACYDLRLKLWPDKSEDPMYVEDFGARVRFLPRCGRLVVTA